MKSFLAFGLEVFFFTPPSQLLPVPISISPVRPPPYSSSFLLSPDGRFPLASNGVRNQKTPGRRVLRNRRRATILNPAVAPTHPFAETPYN